VVCTALRLAHVAMFAPCGVVSRAMAITEQPGESQVDPNWPYRHFTTWELVDLLKQAYEAGQPYDDALVFEVATRAIDAEDPSAATTTF
jgi:hypothetical protein